jgi:Outer membrane protein beta-barrel domain
MKRCSVDPPRTIFQNFNEVRMRKFVIVCVGVMLMALAASSAQAQWTTPLDGRLLVSVNGGGQIASSDFDRRSTFSLYDEEASFDTNQETGSGGMFDIGGVYRVGRRWGVGLAFNTAGSSGDARVSGNLPHPLIFDQPRSFEVTESGVDHNEHAVHLQAVWFMPYTEKIDLTFAAGPSFYSVKQTVVRGFSFSEVPPSYNTVVIDSLDKTDIRDSGVGFNISGDLTYAITRVVGAGVLLRYSYASVGLDVDGQKVDVNAGGLQIAAGARLRF